MNNKLEESPYQIYRNLYCEECSDICKIHISESSDFIEVKKIMLQCAQFRDIIEKRY